MSWSVAERDRSGDKRKTHGDDPWVLFEYIFFGKRIVEKPLGTVTRPLDSA